MANTKTTVTTTATKASAKAEAEKAENKVTTADTHPTTAVDNDGNNPVDADTPYATKVENPDPRFEYYWASTSEQHPQSWRKMKALGYEVVSTDGEGETAPFAEANSGSYTTGDLVLMRAPKEVANAIRQRKHQEYQRRLMAQESAFQKRETGKSSFYFPDNPLAKDNKE